MCGRQVVEVDVIPNCGAIWGVGRLGPSHDGAGFRLNSKPKMRDPQPEPP